MSQQFLRSTGALVRGEQGKLIHVSLWQLRPPKNRLLDALSQPPETAQLRKSSPQQKQNTFSAAQYHCWNEMSVQVPLSSHLPSLLTDNPIASH